MTSNESKSFGEALAFAAAAHAGQVRKHTGEPYILHPVRVALEVARHMEGHQQSVIAVRAALLHDVVEDTDVTIGDVRERFGAQTSYVVFGLTDAEHRGVATPGVDNRAARKATDREWLSGHSPVTRMIKLLDMADNISDWPEDDQFLKVMLGEMRETAEAISNGLGSLFPGMLEEFILAFTLAERRVERHAAQQERTKS